MAEIKPNSDTYRNREEKAAEPKVVAKAKIKEKSFKQKCKEAFIAEDVGDLKEYAVLKVIIPTVKKTIRNLIMNTIDMRFFGKVLGNGSESSSKGGRVVDYDRYSRLSREDDDDYIPRKRKESGGTTLRMDELESVQFESEDAALNVLRYLRGAVEEYGMVSVADFLERADLRANNIHRKWGWYNLDRASVEYDPDTELYYISLPKVKSID